MTTRAEWLALAERCETATGPDREIDAAIMIALGVTHDDVEEPYRKWTIFRDGERITGSAVVILPDLTGSIDANAEIIKRELPGYSWSVFSKGHAHLVSPKMSEITVYAHATPALALCAATCRAKGEMSDA